MANVFGALNRFISRLDADPQAAPTPSSGSTTGYGFQVLRNTVSHIALEPWFDFIIGINGRTLDNASPELFTTEVRNCAGSSVSLGVFSAKGNQIREIFAAIPVEASTLGLSLQWSPLSVVDTVWHILEVMPNSPADVAGLLPYSDYVIGSPEDATLSGEPALGRLVESFMDRPLRLYVYNQEYDVTRVVTITPARHWGGEGALGCVLGYGALHRIPAPLTEPSHAPGETLFDSTVPLPVIATAGAHLLERPSVDGTDGGSAFLIPAEMPLSAVPPPQPPSALHSSSRPPPSSAAITTTTPSSNARKARAHHHHAASPGAGLDDYFAEGEQKSRELDRGSTSTGAAAVPPPPRAGSSTGMATAGPPQSTSPAPPTPASSSLEEVEDD